MTIQEKRRRGRPKGSVKEIKRKSVSVSLTAEEKAQLQSVSAELGMTHSEFVRFVLRNSAVIIALAQALPNAKNADLV
jgi:antitoxin component of RelBE/YafQ-DinJ toxin-antitoxin module